MVSKMNCNPIGLTSVFDRGQFVSYMHELGASVQQH